MPRKSKKDFSLTADRFEEGREGEGFKEQIRIGRRIAAALPQFMSQREVGRRLGISRTLVAREEALALFKLQVRLKQKLGIELGLAE